LTWPSAPTFVSTNTDNPADSPASARGDIFNLMADVGNIVNGRNQANGVAPLDSSTKLPLAVLPVLPIFTGVKSRSAAGTEVWTVPAGVTRLLVLAAGAGGGGGFRLAGDHGGGGGAGGVVLKLWSVSPGDSVTIDVGSGGAGALSGPSDSDGSDGGNTTVTIGAVNAIGESGKGGKGSTSFGGNGGQGGPSSVHDVFFGGGVGHSGQTRGGAGGSNFFTGASPQPSGSAWGGGGYGSGATGGNAFDGLVGGVLILY